MARIEMISIHAPLTGSDQLSNMDASRVIDFNPRSPYGERPLHRIFLPQIPDFNPRSPYGERHPVYYFVHFPTHHFNPRSPYGERHFDDLKRIDAARISIHAPLTGSDLQTKGERH